MTLEITQSDFLDRTTRPGNATNALTMNGNHLEIINLMLSNGAQGIASGPTSIDHLVYGCLIFHNGWTVGFGHGAYVQNADASGKRYLNNLFFDNFGANFAPHGALGEVDYITCGNNIIVNAGSPVSTPRNNIFWDNSQTIISPHVYGNNIYQGQIDPIQNRLGDPDNLTDDVQVYDNYICNAPGALALYGSTINITRLDGNKFYGSVQGWTEGDYPENVYETAYPDNGKKTNLRANAYDNNLASLSIFNFDNSDNVSVDVSNIFSAGDAIHAHNYQDYFVDIQTLTVAGDGTLAIDMQAANRSVARPVGMVDYTPVTTFPTVGCFVLEKII